MPNTKLGGEGSAVQYPLIEYAKEVGWEYLEPKEVLRLKKGERGIILYDIFISQLQNLNPFMDNLVAEEVVKQINNLQPNIQGNLAMWEYLKGVKPIFVPNERRDKNITFIDLENINKNTFHVTKEFVYSNGTNKIRMDVVFIINGFPVLLIETKAAKLIDGISHALNQIKRYHRECPEVLAVLQIFNITHIIKYYYSATWNLSEKHLYNWKEETKGNFEVLVKSFFDKGRLIRLLTDYILFTQKDNDFVKVILRPHQIRAVDKIIERNKDTSKKRALIWHTQGSGKTYTMITTAKKLIENPILKNPTILMLVDRNELEGQLFKNLVGLGFREGGYERASSKKHLTELLKSDRRGLIVSMIHKFEDAPEELNLRENIIVLVDEAHRTTGGVLGTYMMSALPNATFIGFTGTPIDRTDKGKGTFITFGRDDENGYLDKYNISESIEDGTTVKLHYSLAPNELTIDRDVLEKEFLSLAEIQGISDPEALDKVLERAVTLRNMLKNEDRIKKVTKYVFEHFKDYVEPMGYKAFLVCVDREACAYYKEELDKHLPENYSKVVYSSGHNDSELLKKYQIEDEEEKKIRDSFVKPDELPKILIVTEKLLTGFDAPILYCMYLDKPMRDHVLLQAIARVNRPYEDMTGRRKPSGFVLDFVGIFDKLEKALAFDAHDVRDIQKVINDLEILKSEFASLMQGAVEKYITIILGKVRDKAVEAVLEYFIEEENRLEFYKSYKEIISIYDVLSPDKFLRIYLDDLETLSRIFQIVKDAYEPGIPNIQELSRKTAELVRTLTKATEVLPTFEIFEINEETINKILSGSSSNTEKVFNLHKSLDNTLENNLENSPYLFSISEKAENIINSYKQRQINTQEALDKLRKLSEEFINAKKSQKDSGMSKEEFSIYWLLNQENVEVSKELAPKLNDIFFQYPHWKVSEQHERLVKQNLLKLLVSLQFPAEKMLELVEKIMRAFGKEVNCYD